MSRRQTAAKQWLIIDSGGDFWNSLRKLPRENGVLVLCELDPVQQRRLRHITGLRRFEIVEERPRTAARVHNIRELRKALLRRTRLIFLSPIDPTASHPDWKPLPRMRAAALARLGGRKLVALGGMNQRRFAKVARLGFIAWAGISAFRT